MCDRVHRSNTNNPAAIDLPPFSSNPGRSLWSCPPPPHLARSRQHSLMPKANGNRLLGCSPGGGGGTRAAALVKAGQLQRPLDDGAKVLVVEVWDAAEASLVGGEDVLLVPA